ncbi:putative aldouronate transport system permease protein [Paenibacillus sp. 1_12]|uniref:carbohydrate ABC transporter permease n=1 Tax=Paenibacillus sp. 1_12 TaxID=1566278 RepID=UPI0008F1B419|nr:carbohydrate ABC transporter permease [Paenibacillus sp. 1_12]SFK99298.1 putative aldouronate transport system permease protein [Paenibacillus sp. 1_12]
MKITNSLSGKMFDTANILFLGLFSLCAFVPFLYIIGGSFATDAELMARPLLLIPKTISLDSYRYIFTTNMLYRSIFVSIYITVIGTGVNLFFTFTMAYALSRNYLAGRNLVMNLVIFSMLFSGGLIPSYLVVKELGLLNTYWAVMLPGAISAFNMIIVKTFFQELPVELLESARIDGCSDLGVLWRIVLPLSKPIMATFALFYAVGHWNDFFSAMIYLDDNTKWPLQVVLRQIVLLSQGTIGSTVDMDPNFVKPPDQSIKMAVIIVGTVPIMLVYPFLQKHFAKGVLIGALKG